MANIEQETKHSSDLSGTTGSVAGNADTVASQTTEKPPVPVSAGQGTAPVKPTLVQLGSTTAPPQQKRYNAVNINKKFFEKNSSVSATIPSSSISSASKPAVRPQIQTTATHSKLVTAKLTATSQSTSTGPGWSRPSSATPPVAASSGGSPNGTGHSPTSSVSNPPSTAAGGKVIQPQPRNAPFSKDGPGGKIVWGNVKATAPRSDLRVKDEFPTAAEVAQVKHRISESKEAAQALLAANAQARAEEADTFRGVHLDPNAHHWDEMEEDDNFLNGVIEFGDGRQYKVETTRSPPHSPISTQGEDPIPVSKEDRFADDFDRSWPRSRTSPRIREFPPPPGSNTTSSVSPVTASPQEQSRVLFNERSNRLEPYSGTRSGFHSKRGDHGQHESRGGRDVQLLQKEVRGRGDRRDRDAPTGRRESNASASQPLLSPRFGGQPFKDNDTRGRRSSNTMGPPPAPSSRRAPSNSSSGAPGRMPSREGRSARHPSQSPALSHASLAMTSPSESLAPPLSSVTQSPTVDIDALRKEAMQDAAARAKQRRQQEEEEREKQKERARQKAAELEERLQRQNQEKQQAEQAAHEAEAISLIEDAVKAAEQTNLDSDPVLRRTASKQKPPSLNGPSFSSTDYSGKRRPSITSATFPSAQSASSVDSWRSRPNPTSAPPTRNTSFIAPPASALDQSLAEETDAEIEVVDFFEMGKFMGVPEAETTFSPPKILSSRPRPVASDFLDDRPMDRLPTDSGTWRSSRVPDPSPQGDDNQMSSKDNAEVPSHSLTKDDQQAQVVHANPAASHPPTQKTPRSQTFHKEASMSALDDAMSRIKGALDVMHSADKEHQSSLDSSISPKLAPPRDRWLAPALRVRTIEAKPTETFATTGCDPPASPHPQNYIVRLPNVSIARDPVHKRLLILSSKFYPVRWDILSFEPQVEGMNKRDLSLNDVLFPRMGGKRKFGKYMVCIPRARHPVGPKINIPPKTTSSLGAFGKGTAADNASSWRKSPVISKLEASPVFPTIDTASQLEAPIDPNAASISKSDSLVTPVRRSQPKMPAGSSVAFYRDSKIVEDGPMPLVSFIVTSELEDSKNLQPSNPTASPGASSLSSVSQQASPSTNKSSPSLINGVKSALNAGFLSSPLSPGKPLEKKLEETGELSTSHHSWARAAINKESPARGVPDPEHLKAVWSQTSNKTDSKPMNSLEAIADDLTAIPFILPEVKSEDGGTPPPTNPPSTSRMTHHDVTRAFQQVPTSTSTSASSLRPTISPPSTNAPVARPPPSYTYPNQPMRPPYPPYPPPMMSHTPSPIMYPMQGSPIPARMAVNGAPMYTPPVWVPMPTSTPQNPMMRPAVPSPYPTPMMYPTPGTQPMYMQPLPNMQNTQAPPQQQNGAQNRGRGMHSTMMSPVISHAMAAPHPGMPMYASSPVMMHAARVQQNQPGQPQPPGATNTYSMPPSTSFSRPTW